MGLVSIFYQTVGAVEHTILEEQLRGWASQKKNNSYGGLKKSCTTKRKVETL